MGIHYIGWNEIAPQECWGGALTIGNFDGVHLGHQQLLRELHRQAVSVAGPALAMTFDPAPSRILRPTAHPLPLTTLEDRARLILRHGADHVIVLRTTWDLLQKSVRDFLDVVIRDGIRAKTVVPGFNFAFGHNREGTVEKLQELCEENGITCVRVPPFEVDGAPVSSSRIRGDLLAGNVDAAGKMLGRPHFVSGVVGVGQSRGQTLGFPTANLSNIQTLLPREGVYAVRVHLDGKTWSGAANIGSNPTFGDEASKFEVHLIDFSGNLYGANLRVDFLRRIRETRKFSNAAELVEQLHADIAMARRISDDSKGEGL